MNLKPDSRIGSVWIPATGIKAPQVKPATWVSHGIGGVWQFSDGDDETIVADMSIAYDLNREVNTIFGIGWSADGVSPGNCEWQLGYNWLAPNVDTTRAAQTTITQVAAASAIANGMVITFFSNEILLPSEDDVCLQVNIKRLAAGTLDTIADTIEMLGMCLHYAKKEGM